APDRARRPAPEAEGCRPRAQRRMAEHQLQELRRPHPDPGVRSRPGPPHRPGLRQSRRDHVRGADALALPPPADRQHTGGPRLGRRAPDQRGRADAARAATVGSGALGRPRWHRDLPRLLRRSIMSEKFEVGDHVSWNSEAGRVSGTITKVHTEDFEYKGHRRRASEEEPQYEIKSDKTDHIAAHKGSALSKFSG